LKTPSESITWREAFGGAGLCCKGGDLNAQTAFRDPHGDDPVAHLVDGHSSVGDPALLLLVDPRLSSSSIEIVK